VVSANKTLSTLVQSIAAQGGINYSFIDIDPVNKDDGGEPGGNIRVAYLYDPSVIRLRNANPGSNTDTNEVLAGPELKYNPGLIDPSNAAWDDSRKPLAAAWETLDSKNKFFTVNVHFTSKGGGSSIEGDARPPVNGGVAKREAQAKLVAVRCLRLLTLNTTNDRRHLLRPSWPKTLAPRSSPRAILTNSPLRSHWRPSWPNPGWRISTRSLAL
jgi:predicted extracellular nuclease